MRHPRPYPQLPNGQQFVVKRPAVAGDNGKRLFLYAAETELTKAAVFGRHTRRVLKVYGLCASPPVRHTHSARTLCSVATESACLLFSQFVATASSSFSVP